MDDFYLYFQERSGFSPGIGGFYFEIFMVILKVVVMSVFFLKKVELGPIP